MDTDTGDPGLGLAGSPAFIRGAAAFLVLAGVGLAVLRFAGGTPLEQSVEALLSLALTAGSLAAGWFLAAPPGDPSLTAA